MEKYEGGGCDKHCFGEALIDELAKPGRVVEWVTIPSHVEVEGNVEADRLVNQGRVSSPIYPDNTLSISGTKGGEQPPQKKRKVDSESWFSGFLVFWFSRLHGRTNLTPLSNSLGRVPFSDPITFSASEYGNEAAAPNGRGHSSSDSVSNASTVSGDASFC